MKYNVKWIINGNITIHSKSKEKAEDQSKVTNVKKKKNKTVIKGVGPDGKKIKLKTKHKKKSTKLTANL